MTDDLIARLRAGLDEDERVAQAAIDATGGNVTWNVDLSAFHEASLHIVQHDPARVLRWVKAAREILERHCVIERKINWTDEEGVERQTYEPVCVACVPKYTYLERREDALWPCPDVRALASVYGDEGG